MGDEHIRKFRVIMKVLDYDILLDAKNLAIGHGRRGGDALTLSGEAPLPTELVRAQYGDDRFPALTRDDRDLDLAGLDVKDRIGRVALIVDDIVLRMLDD